MSEAYEKICYLYRRWFQRTKVEPAPIDVQKLFNIFAENGKKLSELNFQEFLMKNQGEVEASASETAKKTVAKILKRSKTFSKKGLNLNDFLHFLLGNLNQPLPLQGHLMQENDLMKHTLADYFVYTSHHSYLKRQTITPAHDISLALRARPLKNINPHHSSNEDYKIRSSISAIQKVLKRGIRVIELNLYPNYNNKDVEVHHDRTLYSAVTLSNCLEAIKEHAFTASDLPVIIILVEHINSHLQAIVAAKIRKRFDRMVCRSDEAFNIPIGSLKKKFIILSRKPKQETMESNARVNLQLMESNAREEQSEDYQTLIASHIEDLDDIFMNLQDCEASNTRVLSSTASQLERARSADIISFTQKNLLAVYPNHSPPDGKIVSSNYDPFIGWTRGAQMVAFDTQKSDKYLWIMQGLFRAYGDTGYVRKPSILLDKDNKFDPTVWRPVKKILKVKVYMGTGWHLDFGSKNFDSTSPPDFFAALEIVGVPEDEAREKTLPAMDQWIPTWDQEFEFALTVPEIAMLMIEVREFDPDRTHDFGGQTCLPVWLLRNGIRSVPLYTEKGKPYRAARLLISFQLD